MSADPSNTPPRLSDPEGDLSDLLGLDDDSDADGEGANSGTWLPVDGDEEALAEVPPALRDPRTSSPEPTHDWVQVGGTVVDDLTGVDLDPVAAPPDDALDMSEPGGDDGPPASRMRDEGDDEQTFVPPPRAPEAEASPSGEDQPASAAPPPPPTEDAASARMAPLEKVIPGDEPDPREERRYRVDLLKVVVIAIPVMLLFLLIWQVNLTQDHTRLEENTNRAVSTLHELSASFDEMRRQMNLEADAAAAKREQAFGDLEAAVRGLSETVRLEVERQFVLERRRMAQETKEIRDEIAATLTIQVRAGLCGEPTLRPGSRGTTLLFPDCGGEEVICRGATSEQATNCHVR